MRAAIGRPTETGSNLRSRLADLRAAGSVRELVSGRPHPLKGDRAAEFAVKNREILPN